MNHVAPDAFVREGDLYLTQHVWRSMFDAACLT